MAARALVVLSVVVLGFLMLLEGPGGLTVSPREVFTTGGPPSPG